MLMRVVLLGACLGTAVSAESLIKWETSDEIAFRFEPIGEDPALGLRVDVLNLSGECELILLCPIDNKQMLHVVTKNLQGRAVSPMPEVVRPDESRSGKTHASAERIVAVGPKSAYSWFITPPKQIVIDPRKYTNKDNLQPLLATEYDVSVSLSVLSAWCAPGQKRPDEAWLGFKLLRRETKAQRLKLDPAKYGDDPIKQFLGRAK